MQLLQGLAGSNPLMQQAMQMAQQGDPRQVFMNLAKERGMTEEQIRQLAAQWGANV